MPVVFLRYNAPNDDHDYHDYHHHAHTNREGAAKPATPLASQQRRGIAAAAASPTEAELELQAEGLILQAAERWTRATQAAESDVRKAEREAEEVIQALTQKRQREV